MLPLLESKIMDGTNNFITLHMIGSHWWYESRYSEKFRKFKTDRIEIIATVFACWKDAIEKKQLINDELLILKFYDWSEFKVKYTREQIKNEIEWMKEENIYPN